MSKRRDGQSQETPNVVDLDMYRKPDTPENTFSVEKTAAEVGNQIATIIGPRALATLESPTGRRYCAETYPLDSLEAIWEHPGLHDATHSPDINLWFYDGQHVYRFDQEVNPRLAKQGPGKITNRVRRAGGPSRVLGFERVTEEIELLEISGRIADLKPTD